MVDVVFVINGGVDAAAEWHAENVRSNPGHYSGLLRTLGPHAMAVAQRWGPGLFYNPQVQLATKEGLSLEAKYGVVGVDALLRDLHFWDSLYMAGRLHKPCLVEFWGDEEDSVQSLKIQAALTANCRAALCAALLLCSDNKAASAVSSWDLLCTIVGLSYGGDVRLGLAENPDKVKNIASAQQEDLLEIYTPLGAELGIDLSRSMPVGESGLNREDLRRHLPEAVQKEMGEDVEALRRILHRVVRRSSLIQSSKGVLTAGPARASRYLLQKMRKRFA